MPNISQITENILILNPEQVLGCADEKLFLTLFSLMSTPIT